MKQFHVKEGGKKKRRQMALQNEKIIIHERFAKFSQNTTRKEG